MVVGESPHKKRSQLRGFFVSEDEKIYGTEVLVRPPHMTLMDAVAQGRSLYVCVEASNAQGTWDVEASGAYECVLPPELQLERRNASQAVGTLESFIAALSLLTGELSLARGINQTRSIRTSHHYPLVN